MVINLFNVEICTYMLYTNIISATLLPISVSNINSFILFLFFISE